MLGSFTALPRSPHTRSSSFSLQYKIHQGSKQKLHFFQLIQYDTIDWHQSQFSTKLSASSEGHHFMTSAERKRKHLRPWAEGRTESSMYAKPLRRHARPAKIQLRLADGPESDQLQHWCWVLSGQICLYDTLARYKIVFYYFFNAWTPTCCFSEASKNIWAFIWSHRNCYITMLQFSKHMLS